MNLELGVVCGCCDWYSTFGAATCVACKAPLGLGQPAARPGMASIPAAAPSGVVTARQLGTRRFPPADVEVVGGIAPPASSLFAGSDLKPRRQPSRPGFVVGTASAVRTHGGESAVLSSGALDEPFGGKPSNDKASQVSIQASRATSRARSEGSVEEQVEQAKNYVCKSCSTPVPLGHKFCGRCGAAVPPEMLQARTQFFGQLQAPGKAKLILIRGEGVEGLSYQLNAEQHIVGRNGQLIVPDDPFVSPRHANLFYRGGRLVVRDEGSLNGVFWRVRGSMELSVGDHFLAGEQLLRIDGGQKANDGPAPDGTYFYSSPKHPTQFKLVQILQGGSPAMAVCARTGSLQIGREGSELNFPTDLYMSAAHCKLEESGGRLTLTDLDSRNGTYVRLKAEKELSHGDYLFIGRKLLRVEITAN
ncbi:MAG: FHA domain-containing protein [Myxococcota bacterium]|nr:FHA domain-containing protein [Myxococcota bacterium]